MERVGAMDLSGVYEEGTIAQGGELPQERGMVQEGGGGASRGCREGQEWVWIFWSVYKDSNGAWMRYGTF